MAETGARKWIITITVVVASLLELIDVTIVNVSLPQMMGNLGVSIDDIGWVVTSYTVANVIVLPMSGWLGEHFGRKRYYIASILIFIAASFFCGHAHTLAELITFRLIQGMAGGGLLSPSQAILIETWPREEVGMANAMFGIGAVVGPTIGPAIGGYITDHFSWPWIFYVNIPVGIIAAFLAITFLNPDKKREKGRSIDWWGIVLLVIAIGSAQIALERGERLDWFHSNFILFLAITAVVFIVIFILRELNVSNPVVNFKIMRHRSFSLGVATFFVFGFASYASVFVFPLFCQNLLGFSALQTGELLIPSGLAAIFMMPFVGTALKRGVPAQIISTIGMLLFFTFTYLMADSNLFSGPTDFIIPLIVRGMGMAMLYVPITTLVVQDLYGQELGQGTGFNSMMRQLGGSFGVALSAVFLDTRVAVHRNVLSSYINPYNPAFTHRYTTFVHDFVSKGYSLLTAQSMALKAINGQVTAQVYVLSYSDVYLIVGAFMLCCIPLLFLQKFKPAGSLPASAH